MELLENKMGHPIAFWQSTAAGGGGGSSQVPDVVIDPNSGQMPINIFLSTTQAGAHIFYRISSDGSPPSHTGDNANPGTIRIGSNSGSVFVSSGLEKYLTAVAYQPGYLDSNITMGFYAPPVTGN